VRQVLHSRPLDEVLVVVMEDLHWIDQASEEFVEVIVDAIVGTKTLLVLNFRPGLMAPWSRIYPPHLCLGTISRTGAGCWNFMLGRATFLKSYTVPSLGNADLRPIAG
jgi:hypothetical protein